jgi:response regulator RpfG family c-di-GMP phosphodiesterase
MHPTTGNRAADANLNPAHSDGTGDGATSVLTAAKSALEQVPLRVLLVSNEEEDFYLIREILERIRNLLAADLDHADPLEEAEQMLQQSPTVLVLFEHETGNAEAVQFVADFLHAGVSVPFILFC